MEVWVRLHFFSDQSVRRFYRYLLNITRNEISGSKLFKVFYKVLRLFFVYGTFYKISSKILYKFSGVACKLCRFLSKQILRHDTKKYCKNQDGNSKKHW